VQRLTLVPPFALTIFLVSIFENYFPMSMSHSSIFVLKFILLLVFAFLVKEVMTGVFFALFSENNFKSVKFKIKNNGFCFLFHCKEILMVHHYIIALVMPFVIVGIIFLGFSFIFESIYLLFIGLLFSITCSIASLIQLKMIIEKKAILIYDLPDEKGFEIYKLKE